MAVGVQAEVGRKEPEKQGKEKKYPHREERRKKTKRRAGTRERKRQEKPSKEREQRRREAKREGQEGCQRQTPRVGRDTETRRHTLPHTHMSAQALMCIHTDTYVCTHKSLVASRMFSTRLCRDESNLEDSTPCFTQE